jgi:hypothetical protein
MSSQMNSTPVPPFQQWQQFFPSGSPYDSSMLHEQILAAVTGSAEASKQQFANDIARDTLRAVDRNGQDNMTTTERTAAQLAAAIERNGSMGMSTTERINAQLASAVERNGAAAVSATQTAAGDSRLTTVVTDAASRQAANDTARDILAAVERTGMMSVGTTKDAHNGLLGTIERNAGENRMTTVVTGGQLEGRLTDVRHSIISEVNRGSNELLGVLRANTEDLGKAITNSAWENRTAISNGFGSAMLEAQKASALISKQSGDEYASLLMEQQKISQFLSTKGDNHFAIAQLELQKVKEGLAAQASNYFAVGQLEQQKIRESLSNQLNEAKYEALKSQQFLADKMSECCCEVKGKIDLIDRDRLRDNLIAQKDESNLLKILELTEGRGRGWGGHGHGHGGHR